MWFPLVGAQRCGPQIVSRLSDGARIYQLPLPWVSLTGHPS